MSMPHRDSTQNLFNEEAEANPGEINGRDARGQKLDLTGPRKKKFFQSLPVQMSVHI